MKGEESILEVKMTLKRARLIAEKSQCEVAKALGVSKDKYLRLEKDPEKATIAQAKTISEFLNIPYDEIFFGNKST